MQGSAVDARGGHNRVQDQVQGVASPCASGLQHSPPPLSARLAAGASKRAHFFRCQLHPQGGLTRITLEVRLRRYASRRHRDELSVIDKRSCTNCQNGVIGSHGEGV